VPLDAKTIPEKKPDHMAVVVALLPIMAVAPDPPQ
jgi:hypothetical protein